MHTVAAKQKAAALLFFVLIWYNFPFYRNGETDIPRRNEHVLPAECIICKKDKYIMDKQTLKRTKERLSNCEYSTGKI